MTETAIFFCILSCLINAIHNVKLVNWIAEIEEKVKEVQDEVIRKN